MNLMNAAGRQLRYKKPVATFWWLRRRSYLVFALREISCVFVVWFVAFLLLLIDAVDAGEERYQQFLTWAGGSWISAINVIAAMFLLLHAVTWFEQTPQAFALRLRGRPVPRSWVAASIYLLWIFLSVLVTWLVLAR
jgi:fumarate reductase subunit C